RRGRRDRRRGLGGGARARSPPRPPPGRRRGRAPASGAAPGGGGPQPPGTGGALPPPLERLPCPTVVDADGLNIAAQRRVDWRRSGQPVVLTPHPAEMGGLTRTPVGEGPGGR